MRHARPVSIASVRSGHGGIRAGTMGGRRKKSMCIMPRMRSIPEAHEWLKEQDPGTKITKGLLRKLVNDGVIPHMMMGRKLLIDLNTLLEYLNAWMTEKTTQQTEAGLLERERPQSALERHNPQGGAYGQIRRLG